MCSELDSIIRRQRLKPLFQPIVDMASGQLLGVEALIRGPLDSPLHSPAALFKAALRDGQLYALDLACRAAAIAAFARQPHQPELLLFINITPAGLKAEQSQRGATARMLADHGLTPRQVVVELSEQYAIEDPELLKAAVAHYRQLGFLVALDDLGAGYSSLKLWSQLRPDIVKIDRYFISGIHTDPTRKAFVRSLVELGRATGARIIAEGIENREEWQQLTRMGLQYGQGFLFARPAADVTPAAAITLPDAGSKTIQPQLQRRSARQLCQQLPALTADTSAATAWGLMQTRRLHAMAVVDEQQRPLGLLTRTRLMEIFASDYGRALHGRRPAGALLASSVVIAELQTPLDELGRQVSAEPEDASHWYLILTEQGRYAGLVAVRELLRQLAEAQLQSARYANPLTELPGNVPLHQEISARLDRGRPLVVLYVDIDHFKPFNDHYGYARGDLVIRQLAEILVAEASPAGLVVTHVGGDDFVLVGDDEAGAVAVAERILDAFALSLPHYLDEAERQRGGFSGHSRSGEPCFQPLPGLSIGLVSPDVTRCRCHLDVAELAAEAKRMAKRQGGGLFCSRRRGPQPAWPGSSQQVLELAG